MTEKFDVFMSHNSQDKKLVEELARWLESKNVRVWLDKWELQPGMPWQNELEQGILKSLSLCVFIGKAGFGKWHEKELRTAINISVEKEFPVIPVLLPGCPQNPDLMLFLKDYTWVDFRNGLDDEDGKIRLLWGITGRNPYKEKSIDLSLKTTTRQTSVRNLILEGKNRRLKARLKGLESQADLLLEKLEYFKSEYLIIQSPPSKFALKKRIEEAEKELKKVEKEIDEIYNQI